MTDKPTQKEMDDLFVEETGFDPDDFPAAIFGFARAVLAKWGTPATVGEEPVAWAATSEDGDVEALGMNQSRRFDTPLYTHPPPPDGMAGRMPIETAPKDGSRILLHPAVEVADDWSKGHWNGEHECWIVGGSPSGVVHTAWHPLPPAPSTEGESNG